MLVRYYRDCESCIAEATGARWVTAFDHNVRSQRGNSSGVRQVGGPQSVQQPARFVHGDYTLTSAPERLRQLAQPPKLNDTMRKVVGDKPLLSKDMLAAVEAGSRWAIINVWRNIGREPVQAYPLACTDGMTVLPEDLVVFEIHYSDRVGENYFAKHSPRHKW